MDATQKPVNALTLENFAIEGRTTPNKLHPAEERLLEAVREWRACEISSTLPGECTDGNIIRASFIRFLTLEGDNQSFVHEKGVQLAGACIEGDLDFHGCEIKRPLFLTRCRFSKALILQDAKVCTIRLDGSNLNDIDAQRAKIGGSLYMHGCTTAGEVRLIDADVAGSLECHGAHFSAAEGKPITLYASRVKVGGSVFLHQGFRVEGELSFRGAVIRGNMECTGGAFSNPNGAALSCKGVVIDGDVSLDRGFSAHGEVDFTGATVRGNLKCDGGRFKKSASVSALRRELSGTALVAKRARIDGSVYLRKITDGTAPPDACDFTANGEVNFIDAKVGGSLECHGAQFLNKDGVALWCSRINVAGSVFLHQKFKAEGEVIFRSAVIGGNLDASDARFNCESVPDTVGPDKKSLSCERMRTRGSVFLKGSVVTNQIDFIDARIGGSLECHTAHFNNPGGIALYCSRTSVGGSVFMHEGFKAFGSVIFRWAVIGGNFECDKGRFDGTGKRALDCEGIKVPGDVLMGDGFEALGVVKIVNAEIGGHLGCAGGSFSNIRPRREKPAKGGQDKDAATRVEGGEHNICADALELCGSVIKGNLWLGPANTPPHDRKVSINGSLDLRDARAGVLIDDKESWPPETVEFDGETLKCHIYLDGFTYSRIGGRASLDLEMRKNWLMRQPSDDLVKHFKGQAFEQLARVLRDMGHTAGAHAVAIFQERRRLFRPLEGWLVRGWPWWLSPFRWFRLIAFDAVAGYGYRAHRVVFAAIVVWFACGLAYLAADGKGLVQPVNINMNPENFKACQKAMANKDMAAVRDLDCPEFNAFKFSADVLLPVVQLHEKTAWKFKTNDATSMSALVDILKGAENILGWIVGIILAALLGRKINRE